MTALSYLDPDQVEEASVEAVHRAKELDETVLVAVGGLSSPLPPGSTWDWFGGQRSFLWRSPWQNIDLTSAGSVVDLTAVGRDRFHDVQARWDDLSRHAVVSGPTARGPRLVGGFAFGDEDSRPGPARLPTAMWWVPRAVRIGRAGHADEIWHVTQATPDDDVAAVTEDLLHPPIPPVVASGGAPQRAVAAVGEAPTAQAWRRLIEDAVSEIRSATFEKVVLARRLHITADREFDIGAAVSFLRQQEGDTAVFAIRLPGGWFIGASPELLLQASAGTVETVALAGSAARGWDDEQDAQLADDLMRSRKNRREHQLVVDELREFLRRHCHHIDVEAEPGIVKLSTIQHLKTRLRGRLAVPGRSGLLDLAAELHPTPAMGGFPRASALHWMRRNERIGREWFASPVGWLDAIGEGELAVAIRCALVDGREAVLFAGCGIVEGSVPDLEVRESAMKFQVMLSALGLPPAELLKVV